MDQQTFNLSANISGIRVRVHGDLHLEGWDRADAAADGDPSSLNVREVENTLIITSLDDCQLHIPAHLPATIEKVGGDASCSGLTAPVSITKVSGNLFIAGSGPLAIEKVGGDCTIQKAGGEVSILKVGGDFRAADLQANARIDKVGGDCEIQILEKETSLRADGNVEVGVGAGETAGYSIHAGGDLTVHLPSGAQPNLQIRCGGETLLQFGGRSEVIEKRHYQQAFGSGPNLSLDAGGDVRITDVPWDKDVVGEPEKPEKRQSRSYTFDSKKFEDKITRHAEAAARRAEQRVQNAMRRVDSQMRSEGQSWTWGEPGIAPEPPDTPFEMAAVNEPVTDDERLLILTMIQEKKITVEEAELLLEAMEGQES